MIDSQDLLSTQHSALGIRTETHAANDSRPRLLAFLPGIYADDPFLGGFLKIFESIWNPLEAQMDQLYAYFDPRLAPAEFLPWLGTWVDLVLDENWPEARRRALLLQAADLYRRRGTASGLRDYIGVYMGVSPEIVEDATPDNPFHFTVGLHVPDPSALDRDRLQRIIEENKPAHTTYTLVVEK